MDVIQSGMCAFTLDCIRTLYCMVQYRRSV